jgi:hypothetical protein
LIATRQGDGNAASDAGEGRTGRLAASRIERSCNVNKGAFHLPLNSAEALQPRGRLKCLTLYLPSILCHWPKPPPVAAFRHLLSVFKLQNHRRSSVSG